LKYTKYSCEKLPSSEPKFSQNSLSPNYAVLPKNFMKYMEKNTVDFI